MPNLLWEIDQVKKLADVLIGELASLKYEVKQLETRVKELEPKKRGRPSNSGD